MMLHASDKYFGKPFTMTPDPARMRSRARAAAAREAASRRPPLPLGHFIASVTPRPMPTGQELVDEWIFVQASPLYDGRQWIDGYRLDGQEATIATVSGEAYFQLVDHRDVTSEDAIRQVPEKGYRPITAIELMDLGLAYPDLTQEFQIIALGSYALHGEGRIIAALDMYGNESSLETRPVDNVVWPGYRTRFAYVKDSALSDSGH